jgi:hypothetical protein
VLAIDRLHNLLDVMKAPLCPKCKLRQMRPMATGVESDFWLEHEWRCPDEDCGGRGERFTKLKPDPPRIRYTRRNEE